MSIETANSDRKLESWRTIFCLRINEYGLSVHYRELETTHVH
jgi:hypothetical protein